MAKPKEIPAKPTAGAAIDASGNTAIDPTSNVLSLVEAANKRQDDLRTAQDRLHTAAILHARLIAELRSEFAEKIGKLRSDHMRDISDIRAAHNKELAAAESSRVNAVRQVDVLAVNTAYDRANAAITTLATQTTQMADTLRVQLSNIVTQINDRIAYLEKASNIGAGRQTVTDPAMAELLVEVKKMGIAAATNTGRGLGSAATIALVMSGVLVLAALATFAITFMKAVH